MLRPPPLIALQNPKVWRVGTIWQYPRVFNKTDVVTIQRPSNFKMVYPSNKSNLRNKRYYKDYRLVIGIPTSNALLYALKKCIKIRTTQCTLSAKNCSFKDENKGKRGKFLNRKWSKHDQNRFTKSYMFIYSQFNYRYIEMCEHFIVPFFRCKTFVHRPMWWWW